MILLRLEGNMVVGLPLEVSSSYQPKDNELVVAKLPHVSLEKEQRAYLYYKNGKIEYVIKNKGEK